VTSSRASAGLPGAGAEGGQAAGLLRRLYTGLFALLVPLLLLRLVVRSRLQRAYRARWQERLGYYAAVSLARRPIWLHAVSVGESMAALPLIRALNERWPDLPLVVTTTTPTGAAVIERMIGDVVHHVYFPYDLPWVVRRFLRTFRPCLLVTLETELWPNTFALCRQQAIPVVVANARLSARSLARYRRVAPLSREVARAITLVAAQTAEDAERFRELGAAPAAIEVLGSLKFDVGLPASLREEGEALRRELGVDRPILMAGSTRVGEEPVVLAALRALRARLPLALLVLAPRHPERFDEVAELCAADGWRVTRRSSRARCDHATDVFLVDGMGELLRFYAAADVAFVGGSLLPFGGHNVLEPASVGVPVLVGPHTFNFTEICRLLGEAGALQVVTDGASLATHAQRWLGDSNERDRIGTQARDIVRMHRGATSRTVARLGDLLVMDGR